MITTRKEDQADLWLREHDPYYTDTRKDKKQRCEAPYDTPEMEKRRLQTEIPFSNLSLSQARSVGLEINTDDRTGEIRYNT